MPTPVKDEGNGGQTREEAYMLYLFPPDVKGDSILGDRVPLGGVAEALDAWPEAAAIVRRQYRRLREAGLPVNVARSVVTNLLQLGVTAEATRVTRRWFAAQSELDVPIPFAVSDAGREALAVPS